MHLLSSCNEFNRRLSFVGVTTNSSSIRVQFSTPIIDRSEDEWVISHVLIDKHNMGLAKSLRASAVY
ncbi:hypothetical protein A3752_00845 [Oleiphilus sp. HI0081]|jgi:hypothetical protein|nr:hypothetical protein A3729_22815 [Oleiphilus sp. HI0043]KZY41424.1 hypothetical protein A3732_03010 [Oleiphilus sp. HI0050]KZY56164.1 hypothetical protein A3735_20135 [Oleiphilus sp. HI0061]KZY75204.1 hypothetical protein A3740_15755 [Oleiphilus sp. HI0068]KZY77324.1 hypothetical protein A3741_09770 [Oleiphilus sp. HI0069]KZY88044.1 hypothetical protein A3743_01570 [Oleiphilus sp. HI0072]KZZ07942.1 hypothetical protein A3749_00215 [Oleiphilus sp. HI0078]KZZ21940.1 hypothetical protein A37